MDDLSTLHMKEFYGLKSKTHYPDTQTFMEVL